MIPRVGKSGSEISMETQMLLLEAREESALHDENSSESSTENTFYILLLPVLDGRFWTSLQGTSSNELQFCVESGDANVQTSQALEAVFINSGDNLFELIKNSIKFDLFFRKNPFGGEYTIFAGLEKCIRFIANFKFTEEEISFIRATLPSTCEAMPWQIFQPLCFDVKRMPKIPQRMLYVHEC